MDAAQVRRRAGDIRARVCVPAAAAAAIALTAACSSSTSGHGSGGSSASAPATPTASASAASVAPSSAPASTHATTSAPPVAKTVDKVFRPYDSALKSIVPETGNATGTCLGPSDAVHTYAYRCMSGSTIYDPCFVRPVSVGHQVDCDANPWVTSAVELTLTSVVPSEPTPTPSGAPWAIELANGQRCTVSTGANSTRNGVVLNYYCRTGFAALSSSQYHVTSATASYEASATAPFRSVAVTVRWTAIASAH